MNPPIVCAVEFRTELKWHIGLLLLHVSLQIGSKLNRTVARIAHGRLFSCMELHVPLQIAFELNPILAIIAHWPIFSSVNLHVTPGMRIEIFNGASVILIPIQIKHSVTSVEILHRIQSVWTNITNVETLTLIQTVWWYTCKLGIKNAKRFKSIFELSNITCNIHFRLKNWKKRRSRSTR